LAKRNMLKNSLKIVILILPKIEVKANLSELAVDTPF
jgi:hypothetical protein